MNLPAIHREFVTETPKTVWLVWILGFIAGLYEPANDCRRVK